MEYLGKAFDFLPNRGVYLGRFSANRGVPKDARGVSHLRRMLRLELTVDFTAT